MSELLDGLPDVADDRFYALLLGHGGEFSPGRGKGEAASVAAPFAGLGDGVGSAAKTLESAIRPKTAARIRVRFSIDVSVFFVQGGPFLLKPGRHGSSRSLSTNYSMLLRETPQNI